jgi:hypothetical protein
MPGGGPDRARRGADWADRKEGGRTHPGQVTERPLGQLTGHTLGQVAERTLQKAVERILDWVDGS